MKRCVVIANGDAVRPACACMWRPFRRWDVPGEGPRATPCIGLVARTDPHEQENVTLLDLDDPGLAEVE